MQFRPFTNKQALRSILCLWLTFLHEDLSNITGCSFWLEQKLVVKYWKLIRDVTVTSWQGTHWLRLILYLGQSEEKGNQIA